MTNYNQLSSDALLMAPNSGTVQTLFDWIADYESDKDAEYYGLTFEEWAGELIEVIWSDIEQRWIEVK